MTCWITSGWSPSSGPPGVSAPGTPQIPTQAPSHLLQWDFYISSVKEGLWWLQKWMLKVRALSLIIPSIPNKLRSIIGLWSASMSPWGPASHIPAPLPIHSPAQMQQAGPLPLKETHSLLSPFLWVFFFNLTFLLVSRIWSLRLGCVVKAAMQPVCLFSQTLTLLC
jgi:hypothetical protein